MQTKKDDTAFPIFDSDGAFNEYGCQGLTKREYFAATIAQGVVSSGNFRSDLVASVSVQLADDLIAKLNIRCE